MPCRMTIRDQAAVGWRGESVCRPPRFASAVTSAETGRQRADATVINAKVQPLQKLTAELRRRPIAITHRRSIGHIKALWRRQICQPTGARTI